MAPWMLILCTGDPAVEAAAEARLEALRPEIAAWVGEDASGIYGDKAQIAAMVRRAGAEQRLSDGLVAVAEVGACGGTLEALLAWGAVLEAKQAWYRALPPVEVNGETFPQICGPLCVGPTPRQQAIRVYELLLSRAYGGDRWADPAAVEAWRRLQALDPAEYPPQHEILSAGPFYSGGAEVPVTFLE